MAERKAFESAARSACAQCPWRLENQGRRHRHGFYTKANLRRLWAGIRRGERMTCHPTDPAMAEFEGYEGTADRELTQECVGALVLAQREVMRLQWACEAADRAGARDGYARYRQLFPRGLLRDGFAAIVSATMFGGTPFGDGRGKMARPDLNDARVGYEPLGEWESVDG